MNNTGIKFPCNGQSSAVWKASSPTAAAAMQVGWRLHVALIWGLDLEKGKVGGLLRER